MSWPTNLKLIRQNSNENQIRDHISTSSVTFPTAEREKSFWKNKKGSSIPIPMRGILSCTLRCAGDEWWTPEEEEKKVRRPLDCLSVTHVPHEFSRFSLGYRSYRFFFFSFFFLPTSQLLPVRYKEPPLNVGESLPRPFSLPFSLRRFFFRYFASFTFEGFQYNGRIGFLFFFWFFHYLGLFFLRFIFNFSYELGTFVVFNWI